MSHPTTPVFGITGWKNSGKTTLTAALVRELTARGLKISTIKHAHHAFDIDRPGTDSHRHRQSGAREVMIVSGHRWALMHELKEEDEPPLRDMIPHMSPCDLILIEGYKREPHPKIECRRVDARKTAPLFPEDPSIKAVASDAPLETDLPRFDLNDVVGIADFILESTGVKPSKQHATPFNDHDRLDRPASTEISSENAEPETAS